MARFPRCVETGENQGSLSYNECSVHKCRFLYISIIKLNLALESPSFRVENLNLSVTSSLKYVSVYYKFQLIENSHTIFLHFSQ